MAPRDEEVAWGIKVRLPDMHRAQWLHPDGTLTNRRVHASMNWGDKGKALCEEVAAEIRADFPGSVVTVSTFH